MPDSKQNGHRKTRVHQQDATADSGGAQQTVTPKNEKQQHERHVRADLNPQEDGDENICPDDKNDVEPESGSFCEFQ